MDAFVVSFLDPHVAFATGLGDVGVIDRRIAIHAALDVVNAVAIVAGRRDDKAHLQERSAMDAVFVLGRGLGGLNLIFLREAGVGVAHGAGVGKIEFENRRVGLLHG